MCHTSSNSIIRNVKTMQFGYGFEYGYGKVMAGFFVVSRGVHKSITRVL
jgi:hypothetical protein